jgi:leucyl aminopeptidase (aminopeptidase T)
MAIDKDWELAAAAMKLIREVMLVKSGETVVITCDTGSSQEIVEATARAARTIGAVPVVVKVSLPAKAHREPPKPMAEAIKASDVWIEYAFRPIFFTSAYQAAVDAGTRYLNVARAQVDWFIRVIGDVDYPKMIELGDRLLELTNQADTVHVTSPAGTDVSGRNGGRKGFNHGPATEKGAAYMVGGQVGWCPLEETINGTIVFDGMLSYPEELTQLRSPIRIEVEGGVIQEVSGRREAEVLDRWLRGFDDPNMLRIAHFTYGFNPGAQMSVNIVETERIYGVHVFGIGKQLPLIGGKGWNAPGHTDGIVLNPSVWLDGECVEKDGRFVHPDLAELDRALAGS